MPIILEEFLHPDKVINIKGKDEKTLDLIKEKYSKCNKVDSNDFYKHNKLADMHKVCMNELEKE